MREAVSKAENAEAALAIAYAPAADLEELTALFALDTRLATILQSTTQPMLGLMRLAWWREALSELGKGPPPLEPVLLTLARTSGDETKRLPMIVDGWEALLDDPLDEIALRHHGEQRGGTLFDVIAARLGSPKYSGVAEAGAAWALTDVARHLSDPQTAAIALDLARAALARAPDRWPRRLRCLGMFAVLARRDVERDELEPPGSRARIAAMVWHRISGRG